MKFVRIFLAVKAFFISERFYLPKVMDVLAFGTLRENVSFRVDLTTRNLGKFSRNIESERSEVADANGFALFEVFIEIGSEGFPDDEHLLTQIKR